MESVKLRNVWRTTVMHTCRFLRIPKLTDPICAAVYAFWHGT